MRHSEANHHPTPFTRQIVSVDLEEQNGRIRGIGVRRVPFNFYFILVLVLEDGTGTERDQSVGPFDTHRHVSNEAMKRIKETSWKFESEEGIYLYLSLHICITSPCCGWGS
jgi:hypothetical protein